ncbi:MAG: L,D-transpeptidase family protein [Verrucomicrobia bacterium]|nr:L,D-transpeptidase family protein [Verrucomicrobiota bacterium]|tara:strand:- start:1432 stop:2640 length:1209 start_codon:yes stop_codon:yes gene_type:complete
MRLLQTLLFLPFFAATAFAQVPVRERPVLKALPLDFEETVPFVEEAIPPADANLFSPEASTPAPAPAPAAAAAAAAAVPLKAAPVAALTPIEMKPTGDDAVRLQIFLDQSNFGPGVIDGRPGRFTELAVRSWNEHHGYPLDSWTAVNIAARKAIPNPFAVAIVPEVSAKWVNVNLPYKKAEQAKEKQMSYRSIGEFMSERYHTTVPYLIKLNSSSKIYGLKPRETIVVPNVAAFSIESLTGAVFKEDQALSQRHAVIDTKLNQVRIYEANLRALIVAHPEAPSRVANRSLVAAFPITPGKPQFIRYGKWEMKNAVELPVWRYDQQLLDTGKRGTESLNIPGGPNNPVGVLWCGLSKPGIGMHGTSNPETIGRSQSAGCIRLANWDIVRIPGLLRPGCSVEIR